MLNCQAGGEAEKSDYITNFWVELEMEKTGRGYDGEYGLL